jgi:hypothetical protein
MVRHYRQRAGETDRNVAARQLLDRRCGALISDVLDIEPALDAKQLADHARGAIGTAELVLARLSAGGGEEPLDAVETRLGRAGQRERAITSTVMGVKSRSVS